MIRDSQDLEIIFGRFGRITSCDIIRDYKTGDSLNYAFIGFDTDAAAEEAFFKMDNVLIDDRRIHVDFSQSMHHLWKSFKKFGKAGDAEQGRLADAHQRPAKPGLELKPGAGMEGFPCILWWLSLHDFANSTITDGRRRPVHGAAQQQRARL